MRARILRVTLAAIALTALAALGLVLPARDVSAAAAITKEEALEKCKSWLSASEGGFEKKKNWVEYQNGYKCVGITWDNPSSSQSFVVQCDMANGKRSTKEDGKFNCLWPDGFRKEKDESGNVIEEDKEDVEKVYGGVKADKKCVGSMIIWNEKIDGKKYFCDTSGSGTYEIILIVFNVFSAVVGALGVLGLIISGITYLTARDNEQQVAKAKKRIVQILIGLGIYAMLYLLLQFIIPGGIFGG